MGDTGNVQDRTRLMQIILKQSFKLGDFTLSSGRKSEYYVDCRTTTLHPEGAYLVGKLIFPWVKEAGADAVGGLTLGADPMAAAVIIESFRQGAPVRGFIVRKEQKEHGRGRRIEGNLEKGDRVIILEDVVTTGESALKAVAAVKDAGATVISVVTIVDREEGGREAIEKEGLKVRALFTAGELKEAARRK